MLNPMSPSEDFVRRVQFGRVQGSLAAQAGGRDVRRDFLSTASGKRLNG